MLFRFAYFFIAAYLLASLRKNIYDLQNLARIDALTGLYGRREFDARLAHDLALAQRRKAAFTLAYVDVDDFKNVNDKYGHTSGDRVLRAIASMFIKSLRKCDTAARIGGDEFALLLPDTDGPEAQRVISRLASQLREIPEANDWGVTCSIGVVTFLDATASPEQVLATADDLMYQVKQKGKAAISFGAIKESSQPGATAGARKLLH